MRKLSFLLKQKFITTYQNSEVNLFSSSNFPVQRSWHQPLAPRMNRRGGLSVKPRWDEDFLASTVHFPFLSELTILLNFYLNPYWQLTIYLCLFFLSQIEILLCKSENFNTIMSSKKSDRPKSAEEEIKVWWWTPTSDRSEPPCPEVNKPCLRQWEAAAMIWF